MLLKQNLARERLDIPEGKRKRLRKLVKQERICVDTCDSEWSASGLIYLTPFISWKTGKMMVLYFTEMLI